MNTFSLDRTCLNLQSSGGRNWRFVTRWKIGFSFQHEGFDNYVYPIEYEPGQPAPPAKAPAPAPTTTTARPAPPPPAARPAPAEPLVSAGGIFHSFQWSKHKLWDINKVGVHVIRCNKGQKQLRPVNQLHAQRYTHFFFFHCFRWYDHRACHSVAIVICWSESIRTD